MLCFAVDMLEQTKCIREQIDLKQFRASTTWSVNTLTSNALQSWVPASYVRIFRYPCACEDEITYHCAYADDITTNVIAETVCEHQALYAQVLYMATLDNPAQVWIMQV